MSDVTGGCLMNRRRFLQALGVGAAASAATLAPGGAAGATGVAPSPASGSGSAPQTTFGRMFPTLAAFATSGLALTEALLDLGRPGGVLDAGDDLAAGPLALLVDPALRANNPDNPTQTAGTTFLGQFIDHDVTFDVGSPLGVPADPRRSRNGRTPVLDLESVYGAGPVASSHLYDPADPAKLRYESGGLFEDLPRTADMTAIIADPRNDEHVVLSGLHCAFMKFHNTAVDWLRSGARRDPRDFAAARRLTTWHYQWVVVHEFLPQIVGQAMVDDVMGSGRRFYRSTGGAVMPVEFQGAAYRFGHSSAGAVTGDFGMVDFLTFAGVDPASRAR